MLHFNCKKRIPKKFFNQSNILKMRPLFEMRCILLHVERLETQKKTNRRGRSAIECDKVKHEIFFFKLKSLFYLLWFDSKERGIWLQKLLRSWFICVKIFPKLKLFLEIWNSFGFNLFANYAIFCRLIHSTSYLI